MAYNKFVENFPDYNIHVILCTYTKEEFDSANKIKNNEKIIKSEDYLMNKINYNKITIDEFLKLDENNLMLVTNPGRMGDEDGSYFIMKDNDKFVYMGYGNGLCIDKRIYEEFNKFLELVVSKDPRYKSEEKIPALYYNSWEKALVLYVNEKNIELV